SSRGLRYSSVRSRGLARIIFVQSRTSSGRFALRSMPSVEDGSAREGNMKGLTDGNRVGGENQSARLRSLVATRPANRERSRTLGKRQAPACCGEARAFWCVPGDDV